MVVAIVSRAQWGARPPSSVKRIPLPTPRLWVHHTAGNEHGPAGVRSIQQYHMGTKGWSDIAYSFLVDTDGTVYEGRGVGVAGAHTEGDNSRSHAICLMGNFENQPPTPRALDSVVALARQGRDRGWWVPTLGGHRDASGASTACPGRHVYAVLPDLCRRVQAPTGLAPAPAPPPPPVPDLQGDGMASIWHENKLHFFWVVPDGDRAGALMERFGPASATMTAPPDGWAEIFPPGSCRAGAEARVDVVDPAPGTDAYGYAVAAVSADGLWLRMAYWLNGRWVKDPV